ncbi:hypothetical protein BBBOND_0100210 [Babesia bigemina]|uniref:Extracellular matrix-binding ebh n=1 Tax=Babesia bigemina TaxID=5866 RepID=A0A061D0L8_BABBI|nr:hypothetical protein BBBOND_0100210 [Babesia bigemina]CDR93692.1 hypothetical protein BBBOND_0100210 [Babesia bigemina]|eukprot:XP_012765878.1 hypothetical protein BBBOND_0100210 [Babesia bigemina]
MDESSAHDVISRLSTFQSTLPEDSENPNKNILYNLCTSAGSLLGYRYPGTYDGSEIVYGNASRLCDAILAFLYAVFSDVRDNQPYVAGRDVLHDVIVELKSQLWRGHKGLSQVIPKVATGLRDYNATVKASNKKVKEPIETVLGHVKPDGELRKGIQALQITETSKSAEDEQTVESAVFLVEGCKEVARVFSKSLTAAKDAINDLNPKLKKKLENARRSFFNHVDWLSKWSKKGEKKRLDKMVQKIKSRLKQLAKGIKMKLEGITAGLEEYVKELGQWMGEAKEYINAVKTYVDEIMKQLDGEHRKAIDQAAAEIDSELGKKVEELNGWIEKAEAAVNVAKKKADEVHKRLDKDENSGTKIRQGFEKISEAKDAVSGVSTQLETVHKDLGDWKTAAQGVISKAAGKAGEVSGQLDPSQKGDGNPIGKNLNQIDASNEDIKKANESLRKQTEKLNKWITEADHIREQAQKKAQEVYDSLKVHDELSNKIKEIQTANQTIKDVNSGLGDVDSKLGEWKKEAERVLQDVVQKAEEVYAKLDHGDGQQPITQGIKQIKAAKANVEAVDKGLTSVNDDLRKWREAAHTVIGTVVEKAKHVHEKLDPAKDKSTLGSQIDAIDTARQAIVNANKELERQVKSLNTWINEAEKIRAAAEAKAREAYDKLQVHEKLSENIKKIVDAKNKIDEVSKHVTGQLGSLQQWNEKAKGVVDGAIKKAQEVHDELQSAVVQKVEGIGQDSNAIKAASENLGKEVEDLGKWKNAVSNVIVKADKKCDEILKKVKTSNDGTIFTQAKELQDKGKQLLTAATEARQTVESKVKEALDAVKDMDADLKRDLKVVKDNIKLGIAEVIESLKVGDLGDKVKEDLVKLRERIMKLAENGRVESLVEKELAELNQKKSETLDHAKQKLTEAEKQLQSMFESAIKTPLDDKVKTVENAIEKLCEKINPDGGDASREDKMKFQTIFDHIKKQVGVIKGTGTKSHESGIDGIVANVRGLYNAFVDSRGSGVDARVDGWLGSILGINENQRGTQTDGMKAITAYIERYKTREDALKVVKDQIKEKLGSQIKAGQAKISSQDVKDTIVENLRKVKEACEAFVEELDKKLMKGQIESFADPIVNKIPGLSGERTRSSGNAEHPKTAIRAALIALCSCVRQVAAEVDYLGIKLFGTIIDQIKPTVDGLHTNLTHATEPTESGNANPPDGTAQAVDKAIGDAKNMVGTTMQQKFEQEVKKPVETAIQGFDAAVTLYDTKARQQVKDAAKGAIEEAAKVISADGGSDIDLGSKMKNFHDAHKEITTNLKPKLEKLLNDHIGKDEIPFVGKADRVKLSKNLEKYLKHISVGVLTKHPHGPLAEAIDKIGGEGMKELGVIHPRHIGNDKIDEQTFENPFKAIQLQLEDITKLVSNTRAYMTGEPASYKNGIKNYLEQLKNALGDGKLAGADKGVDSITKAIETLQKQKFDPNSKKIEEAVKAIKAKVEELRKKLLNDNDPRGVIDDLKDLKGKGLAGGTWEGKDGLGKIETELHEQNKKLSDETKIIGEAIHEIKWERVKLGFKLSHPLIPDDILEQLEILANMIGQSKYKHDGTLQRIHDVISELWAQQFSKNPNKIGRATKAITGRLKKLLAVLEGDADKDVIKTIKDLRDVGLSKNLWEKHGSEKGLQQIENDLQRQQKSLTGQAKQIDAGVKLITTVLDELRTALQGSSGNPKIDVIRWLRELLTKGLNGTEWDTGKGKKIASLGQIKKDLRGQNDKLAAATKKIEDATNTVMSETQDMLRKASQKLSGDLISDTIVKNLQLLEKMIGRGQNGDSESLQAIQKVISGLQAQQFDVRSKAIEEAKHKVEHELTRLEGELVTHVADPLKHLIQQGFGNGDQWNGNAKGFDNINHHLQRQQETLSQQPKDIQGGVTIITTELDELRTVLQGTANDKPENKGVIKNLEFMAKHIGEGDNEGLKKLKSDMESLKKNQGQDITNNLDQLSRDIQHAAAYADWHVTHLENPHINGKLKGIQDGLDNLRLTDLADAIRLCDNFLNDADEIERNTVQALWKHVDDEVEDAIKDLTKEARGLYVDSVREALALFAKKVNEDLEQLPNEINKDMYVGYKGFMKYLQGPLSSDLTGHEQSVAELSSAFREVFEQIEKITRLHDEQNKEKNPSLPPTEDPYTPKLKDVYDALTALLAYLRDNDDGADKLTELVERLTKALGDFVPSDFKHPCTPLLDTVARGLTKFAGEFGNCYISAYSGQRCREERAHKYAKVLLSLIPMTHNALNKLMMKCEGEWKYLHISKLTADYRDNPLGYYLTRCGYRVSSGDSGQDGELNNMFTGGAIYELLTTRIEGVSIEMMIDGDPIKNGISIVTIISLLYNVLCHYFQACHITVPPEPRYPCTVRDMLSWLSGLQYTAVVDKLPEHCKALLNRRCHDGDTPNREDPVMAKCIDELPYTIASTCSYSTALLTAIQGNVHGFDLAAYPYSVDFSNNRARLHYPSDPVELLDIVREIVCRLCKVLYFLYSQCCRSTARVRGWRECAYGRQVQSHNWKCKQFTTYFSISTTTAATTTTTTSSTTTIHGCPPTSPLQSFLSDSCHGLLPHTLTTADGTIECANCAANQPGQQCLTPLGFWDLGFAASITGTGWDLTKRLGDMCRDADSCLFVLYRSLFLLCPAAPSSLAAVFALYAQLLRKWDPHDRVRHRGGTYSDASDFISHLNTDGIDSLFPLWTELHGSYQNENLTTAISSLAGHDHKSHDTLSSLFNDTTCSSSSGCAPYLQPLGLHAHHTYPQKHAGLYITWIMYLAWQFWELLCELLHALDNIDCTASGCATCPCQPGTHGGKGTCHCPSIVQCAGPLPTLYRYGFTYRNANLLVNGNRVMRCGDLNIQGKKALHSDHFTELFRQIDQLMWHIRMPFLYFLIALWSLVALYILHTFLYRMEILRILSHLLTTKASHLDAKALLISSRKMLSLYDASYFYDDPIGQLVIQ